MHVLKDKIVTTRKDHQCFGCLKMFPAGSRMAYQFNVDSGDTSSIYTCRPCAEIMKTTDPDDPWSGAFCEGYAVNR